MAGEPKNIALTFDDGPNDPYTGQILDTLAVRKVKATFFVVGQNVRRQPHAAKRIVDEGHIIANHSDRHRFGFMLTAGPAVLLRDIGVTERAIAEVTGKHPRFYRPPWGLRTPGRRLAIERAGYAVVMWNNMTVDYLGLSPTRIASRIVAKARPGGVIVLHDGKEAKGGNRANVVAALPLIIERLQGQGYRFVGLDDLLGTNAYL